MPAPASAASWEFCSDSFFFQFCSFFFFLLIFFFLSSIYQISLSLDGFLLLYRMRWISQTFKAIFVTGGTKGGEALLLSFASIWAAPLNTGKTDTRYFNSIFLHWSSFPPYQNFSGWLMHSSEVMGTVRAWWDSSGACPIPCCPSIPITFSCKCLSAPQLCRSPVASHAAIALWSDQAHGHPHGSGAAGPLGWRSELPSPSSKACHGQGTVASGWFMSRSSGFQLTPFLKANKPGSWQRGNYAPESC